MSGKDVFLRDLLFLLPEERILSRFSAERNRMENDENVNMTVVLWKNCGEKTLDS